MMRDQKCKLVNVFTDDIISFNPILFVVFTIGKNLNHVLGNCGLLRKNSLRWHHAKPETVQYSVSYEATLRGLPIKPVIVSAL